MVVAEREVTVLVVRTAGNSRDVDLIVIVLARVHDLDAGLDRVISPDLRHAVGVRVNRAARLRWVWSAGQAVETAETADRRDLVRCSLAARDDVREVDTE